MLKEKNQQELVLFFFLNINKTDKAPHRLNKDKKGKEKNYQQRK